ncbi:hypothetical protein [Suttonella ornithocola]|uniref:Uncharacterized protein n=1 Tax=Suttonella ornithocola TaxID=279832 RepID=A0A380MLA6_9GAMM|nr:hypothetical protein [Suttonella ornithocola]SUO93038.1 Uncharacterised protein [Suttonella ornithocola]
MTMIFDNNEDNLRYLLSKDDEIFYYSIGACLSLQSLAHNKSLYPLKLQSHISRNDREGTLVKWFSENQLPEIFLNIDHDNFIKHMIYIVKIKVGNFIQSSIDSISDDFARIIYLTNYFWNNSFSFNNLNIDIYEFVYSDIYLPQEEQVSALKNQYYFYCGAYNAIKRRSTIFSENIETIYQVALNKSGLFDSNCYQFLSDVPEDIDIKEWLIQQGIKNINTIIQTANQIDHSQLKPFYIDTTKTISNKHLIAIFTAIANSIFLPEPVKKTIFQQLSNKWSQKKYQLKQMEKKAFNVRLDPKYKRMFEELMRINGVNKEVLLSSLIQQAYNKRKNPLEMIRLEPSVSALNNENLSSDDSNF